MAVTGAVARTAAALIVALAALGLSPGAAAAADPILPRPSVDVQFLSRIRFSGSVAPGGNINRIEIVIDIEGSSRSIVADLSTPGSSSATTLTYDFDTPGGSLLPNTDLAAHFRATLTDGREVEGPSATVHYEDTRFSWQVMTGSTVTVHWTDGGTTFGQRALKIGEDAVAKVSRLLGVTETDPIDFYVYADNSAFYDVLGAGARENVGGEAHPDIRTLFAQISPDAVDAPWVGIVIPHELTHLVFDTAVKNPYHYPPRWLNEGIAEYLSQGYTSAYRRDVQTAVDDGTLIPLRGLSGQFPTTASRFYLAYAESTSAVDFLVARYGETSMITLVRSYADGVTDDEAFRAGLGTDVAGFEAAWLDSLGAQAPSPFGPADAPPGPVPSDWVGAGQVPGPIESVAPGASPTAAPTSTGGGRTTDPTGIFVALLVAGLTAAGVGAWLFRRNRPRGPSPAGAGAGPAGTAAPAEPDAGRLEPGVAATTDPEPAAGDGDPSP